MEYLVRRANAPLRLDAKWPDAQAGTIAQFHPQSSAPHPLTQFRMLYDDRGLYISFDVRDRYVLCRQTENQQMVCRDSCVEAFLQPRADRGYFNFETNCCGAMLLYYVTDPTRVPGGGGLKGAEKVSPELMERISKESSLPARRAFEEVSEPMEWRLAYFVPNEVFEAYVGELGPAAGRHWRGNFYKCADESSRPHWGAWANIGETLNFHQPGRFGEIDFE